MSKRHLGLLVAVAVALALALSTIAYLHLGAPREESAANDSARIDSSFVAASASQGQQTKSPNPQSADGRGASSIPASMSPERAYADAHAILRCSHAANDSLSLPEDMTGDEKKQFEKSRIEGLDCSALDNKHTAYDLAKFAAEKGNLQAQLDFPAIAASAFNEEKNALDPVLIAQFKSDSLKYLNMAAATGNPDAYGRLAENYRTGLFSQKDNIKAYAYAYAKNQLDQTEISRRWADQFSRELSPSELLQAQQLGQSLINRK